MISTSVMIKLGRVRDNRMVDMQLSNDKLVDRGVKMVVEKLNNRPRKRYQYNSPNEVYLQKLNNNKAFAFIN